MMVVAGVAPDTPLVGHATPVAGTPNRNWLGYFRP